MQCRAGQGACPDTLDSRGSCSNDVTLVTGLKKDGQQCVVYSRKFAAGQTPSTSTTFLTSHLFLSPPNSPFSFSYLSLSLSCSPQVKALPAAQLYLSPPMQRMRVTWLWTQTRTSTLYGEWVDWGKQPSDISREPQVINLQTLASLCVI